MTTFTPDLVCADCGDTDISVECLVVQNKNGVLQIIGLCDEGHSCNSCGGEHITERLRNDTAVKEIQQLLDRKEWDAETVEQIADIVRRTGRPVRHPEVDDPDEPEPNPGSPVDTTQCKTNDWCTKPEGHIGACRDVEGRELATGDFGPTYGAQPGGA